MDSIPKPKAIKIPDQQEPKKEDQDIASSKGLVKEIATQSHD